MKRLILVRQTSPLRHITEQEVVAALSPDDQKLERRHVEVAMSDFADAIEQGDWDGQDRYLREHAASIRQQVKECEEVGLHYFGMAEVPHIVALGAHLGDQRAIVSHDHDRDTGTWRWPSEDASLSITTSGDSELGSVVKARGPVVIRVAISAAVVDSDVREAVGDETIADVTITHQDGNSSAVAQVRSEIDVRSIRQEFRRVFALVRNARPNVDTIHLFIAAPPSVCLAIGQELTLRNSPPIQLYRYRKGAERSSQQAAILLTVVGEEQELRPLATAEVEIAAHVRKVIWPAALLDLKNYVANKQSERTPSGKWFIALQPQKIEAVAPFSSLPALKSFLPTDASVHPEPFYGDYGFEKTTRTWRLGDRLLLGLYRAVDGNEERLRQLIRLFLFHEYLHDYHSITKHTAEEVGKFPNCLEYLDYTADTYAILHQLDLSRYGDARLLDAEPARRFLADQVELAIKSFWAFDTATGDEWQVRRIRRYLNWYWRLIQLENATGLEVLRIFCRQPHLEIGGLYQVARGRRVIALLDRQDSTTHLELAVVLENDRLFRITDSPNTNLPALLRAFSEAEHDAIKRFFRAVYDIGAPTGGVQPAG